MEKTIKVKNTKQYDKRKGLQNKTEKEKTEHYKEYLERRFQPKK